MIEKILSQKGKGVLVRNLVELSKLTPTQLCCMDIETSGAEDLPGDSPFTQFHGISGLAICNSDGEAVYVVVDDSKNYGGIPVKDLAEYVNKNWLTPGAVVVFHNAKFDLGFLRQRGFDFSKVQLVDTWMLHSLACNGVFVSNKLKDIMKNRFGIEVESEEIIKKWLEDHKTRDYGDIPVDLIGPYAADDVRYGMALKLALHTGLEEDRVRDGLHDRYINITNRLIDAEAVGIAINVEAMKATFQKVSEQYAFNRGQLLELLKAVKFDLDNDQEVLSYLHFQNLHPGPSELFGESKFHFNREYLSFSNHPVTRHYRMYYLMRTFREQFGPNDPKGLKYRLSMADGVARMHPSYMLSIFSKGGLVQCKKPELQTVLSLTDKIRALFIPTPGYKFVSATCVDLSILLLAYYCKDKAFQFELGKRSGKDLCLYYAQQAQISPEAISLLFNAIIEGHGKKLLVDRLKAAQVPGVSSATVDGFKAKLIALLPSITDFSARLREALSAAGSCKDICGAKLVIPEDKRYRAPALLIASGYGNILALYLEQFCRVADKHGARLVFARENEFLFECPEKLALSFSAGLGNASEEKLLPIMTSWMIWNQGEHPDAQPWQCTHEEANRFAVDQFRK